MVCICVNQWPRVSLVSSSWSATPAMNSSSSRLRRPAITPPTSTSRSPLSGATPWESLIYVHSTHLEWMYIRTCICWWCFVCTATDEFIHESTALVHGNSPSPPMAFKSCLPLSVPSFNTGMWNTHGRQYFSMMTTTSPVAECITTVPTRAARHCMCLCVFIKWGVDNVAFN